MKKSEQKKQEFKFNHKQKEFERIHGYTIMTVDDKVYRVSRTAQPVIATADDISDFYYFIRSFAYNRLMFKLFRHKSDFYVVSSNYQKKQLCRLGIDEKRIFVINNFINFNKLATKDKRPDRRYASYKKPIIIWGASVGPFSKFPKYEQYMKNHLNKINGIFAREAETMDYLFKIGVFKNVRRVADPAFLFDLEKA